jgi:hypothetical protein
MRGDQLRAIISTRGCFAGLLLLVGCSSTDRTLKLGPGKSNWPVAAQEEAKTVDGLIGMEAAFIRRVGQEVKARGYRVIFTDITPESLERDAPELFRDFAKRSSGEGVQVRGQSRSEEKNGQFRDKITGERGVVAQIWDIEEDENGGRILSGIWMEGAEKEQHEVRYLVLPDGGRWKAEPFRSPPRMTEGMALFPGLFFFEGAESLSGQLIFQRRNCEQVKDGSKCASNIVYALDLETKKLSELANLGSIEGGLIKVSDDAQMLCFYDVRGSDLLNARFYVHSVANARTKQFGFTNAVETFDIAILGNAVFIELYSPNCLYQYDYPSGRLSEFRPAGLPVSDAGGGQLSHLSLPRTRFSDPGVLYFEYNHSDHYRWTALTGELESVDEFSNCMTADGKNIWLGERRGNSYPLYFSSKSEFRYWGKKIAIGTVPIIAEFKFPGGRDCHLDQLSPSGQFALLTVEGSESSSQYIVNLKDGANRLLLRSDSENVGRVFWVKKAN